VDRLLPLLFNPRSSAKSVEKQLLLPFLKREPYPTPRV
jgi:hypothetical protein